MLDFIFHTVFQLSSKCVTVWYTCLYSFLLAAQAAGNVNGNVYNAVLMVLNTTILILILWYLKLLHANSIVEEGFNKLEKKKEAI